jgi:hypothetical protein
MLNTKSLPEILQFLEDRDGYITLNDVLETASLYDGKAPASVPIRGSLSLEWHVFNELLTRRWIEKVQGRDMCKISAAGIEHLKAISLISHVGTR